MKVLVLCLGDLGHSPRICNAARELAQQKNTQVCLLGHIKSEIAKEVQDAVTISSLEDNQQVSKLGRQLVRCLSLFTHLLTGGFYDAILVQNPPSVTVLWILLLYRWFCNTIVKIIFGANRKCQVFVDCHNYGWTLMSNSRVADASIRGIFEELELGQMRKADRVLVVSESMKKDLVENRRFDPSRVFVYYDVPGEIVEFKKETSLDILKCYYPDVNVNCPLRVVTSTSYTPDESIDWLVRAVAETNSEGMNVELIITGKGPQYNDIQKLAKELSVNCCQIFVDHADYLPVLASAHLGVCLHRSSSGLDLPMKIVDMRKVKLPILAFKYPALVEELQGIEHFGSQAELAAKLKHCYTTGDCGTGVNVSELKNSRTLVQCLFD